MKKTFNINLSGVVFHIDEDAYEILKNYLSKVHKRYENTEEGKEIIADIESRIAELFTEKLKNEREVIVLDDVNSVIETMGDPGEFEEDQPFEDESGHARQGRRWNVGKRLYRDTDNRLLGGVCSGIAAYLDIDPVLVRVIFIITLFVPGLFLLYFILWIVVPQALTTSQKLEMKGERVNISNIEKSITEEFNEVKNNFRKFSKSKQYEQTRENVHSVFRVIGQIIQVFLKIIVGIIGIAFVIAGITIVFAMVFSMFSHDGIYFMNGNLYEIFNQSLLLFADIENVRLLFIGLALVIGLPVLAILYGGIKLIFKFDANDKVIGVVGFTLWFIGLLVVAASMITVGTDMRTNERYTDINTLKAMDHPTLYVSARPDTLEYYYNEYYEYLDMDEVKLISSNGYNQIFIIPEINIVRSKDNQIHIREIFRARGSNRNDAYENAHNIVYNWEQKDSLLLLDPYYTLKAGSKWRAQEYELVIELPAGKSILLDETMNEITWESDYMYDIWPGNLINQSYTMTDSGLVKSK